MAADNDRSRREPRPNIVPSVLFVKEAERQAESALDYYASLLKILTLGWCHYPDGQEPNIKGVMFAEANLDGTWIAAMDGGDSHKFAFNEGISFAIE